MAPSQTIGFKQREFFILGGFTDLYLEQMFKRLNNYLFPMHIAGYGLANADDNLPRGIVSRKE